MENIGSTDDRMIKIKEALRIVPMEDAVLLYGSSSKFYRVSGEKLAVLDRVLALFKDRSSVHLSDLKTELNQGGLDDEETEEVIETLTSLHLLENAQRETTLSPAALDRYRLQINYFADTCKEGTHYLELLNELKVLVIGAEIIGSRLLASLAQLGVGTIRIIPEWDLVSDDEHYNGYFFRQEDVRKEKSEVVPRRLKEINPLGEYQVLPGGDADLAQAVRESDFVIVANDVPDIELCYRINEISLLENIPWTRCGYFQDEGFVGPTILPHKTPCFECFDKRSKGTLRYFDEYLAFEKTFHNERRIQVGFHPYFDAVASYVSAEMIRLLAYMPENYKDVLEGRKTMHPMLEEGSEIPDVFKYGFPESLGYLVTIDLHSYKVEKHSILKLPRCASCGVTPEKTPRPLPWGLPL